ncbi:MAG: ABC transporter ATP-binding protein [Lachnospiraceae bacterium]
MKKENPIKILIQWAGRNNIYFVFSVLCAFCCGLCAIVPYLGVFRLINAILKQTADKEFILHNVLLITEFTVLRFVLFGLSGAFSHKGAYGALFRVRCMIIDHMAKVPLGVLNERRTGDMKAVLNEDIEKLEQFLAHNIPDLVHYLVGPLAIFIYLMTINVPLALVSILPLVFSIVIMGVMFMRTSGIMERYSKSIAGLNSVFIEYINGMKLIKAYNMGSRSFAKFSGAIKEENDVVNTVSRRLGPPYAAYVIIIECGLLLVIPIGSIMYLNHSIMAGAFLLFIFIGSIYLTELRPLQQLGNDFAQVFYAITNAKEILDIPVYEGGSSFPKACDIELQNVTFDYNSETAILKNCSLRIEQGEKVALIGRSGAGKSTVIQLISRSYDVKKGRVRIGGTDVRDISYNTLLQNIAIVFQKTFLTDDSVLENIRMGSNAALDEVRAAARGAQIDDFIISLPDGYDTKVGSFSSRFSGGEKQRIAIARAILKNAPILILDEATSAADPENQVEIDKAIENLCKGKTVLIVAHRLGAVKMCNKVAVLENGTVTSFGKHETVLQENAYYQAAWRDYNAARAISYKEVDIK